MSGQTAERLDLFHPAASIFPLMAEADLAALTEDIRRNGQLEPIVVAGGSVLDGRNRWLACQAAGMPPAAVEWDGVGGSVLNFVVSKNLHRRHLNISQRALIAAEIANLAHGGDRKSDQGISVSLDPVTAEQAGVLMSVSRPLVLRAKTVMRHGTAEEVEAVRQGKATVSGMAERIWNRQREKPSPAEVIQFPQRNSRSGARFVKLPDGMMPEAVARKALELRKHLPSAEKVAEALGIRTTRCQQMMDVVLVADRADLSVQDAAVAIAALRAMNEQATPLLDVHGTIRPIMRRLWGNRRGPSRKAAEANRSDRFEHGLGILVQSCLNGAKIEIPHLAPDRARTVLRELQQAIDSIRVLMAKIERISQ